MRIRLVTIFLLLTNLLRAQEGQFTQFFASSSIMNPAFSGIVPNVSLNANFKTGGDKTKGSYFELTQATATLPFKKLTSYSQQIGGLGMTFFRERRGVRGIYTFQKVLFTGSYRLKLSAVNNQYLIFGLQGGVGQNKLDGSLLKWGSQFNRYLGNGNGFDNSLDPESLDNQTLFYPVFNFGMIFSTFDNENIYIRDRSLLLGASVENLNRPVISNPELKEARKEYLFKSFGSAKMEISPRWFMHPSFYFLYSNGSTQTNLGFYVSTLMSSVRSRNSVLLQFGSWYRLNGSFSVLTGFQFDDLRLGLSFDLNQPNLDIFDTSGRKLTYEISLTYNLDLSNPLRHIPSPIL